MQNVPWNEVPDDNKLPNCIVLASLEALEKRETKPNENSAGGKLMFVLTARIKQPKPLKGLQVSDNYVVGTDDDPEAEELDTLKASIGLKRMKRLWKASGADLDSNATPMKLFKTVKGKDVVFEVTRTKQEKGRFAGTYNNNIVAMYSVAEAEELGLKYEILTDEEDEDRPRRRPAAASSNGRRAAAKDEDDEEEETEEEEKPRGRRVARRAAPAEAEEAEEEDPDAEEEEEEEEEKPRRTAGKAGKAASNGKAKPGKKSDMVKCQACGDLVARDEFEDHLEEKHADDD
jgi:ribosomal protein L44E